MGTIANLYEYKFISPEYTMKIDNEFVLVDEFEGGVNIDSCVQLLNLNKIDTNTKNEVIRKLFKNEMGGIITHGPAFECCISSSGIYHMIYENSTQLHQSIYNKHVAPHPKVKLRPEGQ